MNLQDELDQTDFELEILPELQIPLLTRALLLLLKQKRN